MRPRRSVLYMPGANARAMEKAKNLPCDSIIFDLEDAVSPDSKSVARNQVESAIQSGGYGYRELVVRCNSLHSPWGKADVERFACADVAALLFPKIESADEIAQILDAIDDAGGTKQIWLMIETPKGVLDVRTFAAHPNVEVLVMGTSDLVKELRAEHTADRSNLAFALQQCVLSARLLDKEILDGVHLDFRNQQSLREVCSGGRSMGFDGKTLIHPSQIETANEVFGHSEASIAGAYAVLEVWQEALASGKGVAVLDGKLVENLHAAEAERVIAFAEALAARG